jgi:hypothetical protein
MTCCRTRQTTRSDRRITALGWMIAVILVAGAIHPLVGVVTVLALAALTAAHLTDEGTDR